MKEENSKQLNNVSYKIGKLEGKISGIQDRLDNFIDNDFQHLRNRVDWIFWIFILGTLVSIAISLIIKK
ncbi:MAG: hypothetical protein ACTSR2_01030 [Candidatus Hodarchaeales archaeon]